MTYQTDQELAQRLKTIRLIHLAICSGVIVILLLLIPPSGWGEILFALDIQALLYVGIVLLAIALARMLFRQNLKANRPKPDLDQAMAALQTASIIQLAIIEGVLFALIIIDPLALPAIFLGLVYMLAQRPRLDQAKELLSQ